MALRLLPRQPKFRKCRTTAIIFCEKKERPIVKSVSKVWIRWKISCYLQLISVMILLFGANPSVDETVGKETDYDRNLL